ncbi:hypothetical protein [uncultured Arcobacter sp.]|uniref:hypothetical protein n=1 Tax=uncultured Arcobacter sp. TaxID=165434 RepID=UPI002601912A|nr:hypothetical protein [uncultured Arcobacter sp.]
MGIQDFDTDIRFVEKNWSNIDSAIKFVELLIEEHPIMFRDYISYEDFIDDDFVYIVDCIKQDTQFNKNSEYEVSVVYLGTTIVSFELCGKYCDSFRNFKILNKPTFECVMMDMYRKQLKRFAIDY